MPAKSLSSTRLPHQIFHGTTWHSRLLPNIHKFTYPYRYWGVNITALTMDQPLPEVVGSVSTRTKMLNKLPLSHKLAKSLPIFSAKHQALQRFFPDDYLQGITSNLSSVDEIRQDASNELEASKALLQRLKTAFEQRTDSMPTGDIIGLVVCRNVGFYFSPVNFYLGFDHQQNPTHLLAEVSNTPWDKRHYYGFRLKGNETEFCHDKDFHVSPFNPIDQRYCWQVSINSDALVDQIEGGLQVRIAINISDERGLVLKTGVKMSGEMMTPMNIRHSLSNNTLMNFSSLTRIYWHAFKLYAIKKVPYINYDEKLADSDQNKH